MGDDFAQLRRHLRDYFQHINREGGTQQILRDLTNSTVRLLDPLGTEFTIESPGSHAWSMRILDARAEDAQAQPEAILWTFFDSIGFGRGYWGPWIPPKTGRIGLRFAPYTNVKLLNIARLLDVTIFSGEEARELRRVLMCADRGDIVSPRRRDTLTRLTADLIEEGVQAQPMVEDLSDEEQEEFLERDPLHIALDDVEDALRADEAVDLIVVRTVAGDGDARLLLHEGPRPVENVMNLLVQILSTLRTLNDSDGFVHGRLDLRGIAYKMLTGTLTPAELDYPTPYARVRIATRGGRSFPLFSFQTLSGARLSDARIRGFLSIGQRSPSSSGRVHPLQSWLEAVGQPAQSHALDLHALGLNVIEAIAWRLQNKRDTATIKDTLWNVARFCLQRLLLQGTDIQDGEFSPLGHGHRINLRRLWSTYRHIIKGTLRQERSAVGNAQLGRIIFATYSQIESRHRSESVKRSMAERSSDPDAVRDREILVDVLMFPRDVTIKVANHVRLNWWTHPLFDPDMKILPITPPRGRRREEEEEEEE